MPQSRYGPRLRPSNSVHHQCRLPVCKLPEVPQDFCFAQPVPPCMTPSAMGAIGRGEVVI